MDQEEYYLKENNDNFEKTKSGHYEEEDRLFLPLKQENTLRAKRKKISVVKTERSLNEHNKQKVYVKKKKIK